MRIDGKQATSGTLVITPNQEGTLDFAFGSFRLVFKESVDVSKLELKINDSTIEFTGPSTSLGFGGDLNLGLSGGQTATLTLVAYAIGQAPNFLRVVHYTLVISTR